mgnify:CR=1 FL=1
MEHAQLLLELLYYESPNAIADIYGSSRYPLLRGLAKFYTTYEEGILISVEVVGLPDTPESGYNVYGLYIHENGNCSEDFIYVGDHLNLTDTSHPFHTGDLPPLLSNNGYAWMAFYDDRFDIEDVLGRSIVIHSLPDLMIALPSPVADQKIACGIITASR